MAAAGADLLVAQAARAAGSEIACVLPFALQEYLRDFSPPDAAAAQAIIAGAKTRFVLPGERGEPRSYERANEVILANIDLLIALWDGKRATGRGGTGDVVQSAISRGIPVIVIAPDDPAHAELLVAPGSQQLEKPIAVDLARKPAGSDLTDLVSQVLSPPARPPARPVARALSTSSRKRPATEGAGLNTPSF
jgi:hypothetical protein